MFYSYLHFLYESTRVPNAPQKCHIVRNLQGLKKKKTHLLARKCHTNCFYHCTDLSSSALRVELVGMSNKYMELLPHQCSHVHLERYRAIYTKQLICSPKIGTKQYLLKWTTLDKCVNQKPENLAKNQLVCSLILQYKVCRQNTHQSNTHTHTLTCAHTQNNYHNPCAHAPSGNNGRVTRPPHIISMHVHLLSSGFASSAIIIMYYFYHPNSIMLSCFPSMKGRKNVHLALFLPITSLWRERVQDTLFLRFLTRGG